jgi:hypothetical protein
VPLKFRFAEVTEDGDDDEGEKMDDDAIEEADRAAEQKKCQEVCEALKLICELGLASGSCNLARPG